MFKLNLTKETESVIDISDDITEVVDAACIQQSQEDYAVRGSGVGEVAFNRIGAGYVNVECARELAYKFHKYSKREMQSVVSPGELSRHGSSGHWTEEFVVSMLRKGGFTLLTHKPDGSQYNWMDCYLPNGQAQVAGELDGIFTSYSGNIKNKMTEILDKDYPVFYESKKATHSKWCKFSGVSEKTGNPVKGGGVKQSDQKYYGQMIINMAMHEAMKDVPYNERYTLFTMLNLNSMKLYCELVKFDVSEANRISERIANVIGSKSPDELPKIQEKVPEKGWNKCRFCVYAHHCWGNEISF